jgi:tetratricopeptide (TPR) repeat protein
MDRRERLIELDDTGEWDVTTEEFLAQIHRSSELMRQDRGEEARRLLENAFDARKDDPSGQATLGLVYFKLGIYPRALAIYQRLAQDYPKEPALRLNLGLVYLKTGQTESAARELEVAAGLAPNYQKAQAYLGLAYQRLGNWFGAKQAFEKAGAKQQAERAARFAESEKPCAQDTSSACDELEPIRDSRPEAEEKNDKLSQEPAGFLTDFPFSIGASSQATAPISVEELSAEAKIPEPPKGGFLISKTGYLLIDIRQNGISRLDGLHFLSAAHLSYKPLKRRFRGTECQEPFGRDQTLLYEIQGNGRLGFHPKGHVFSAVSLNGDAAFIREEYLFALAPTLDYESGKIPGDGSMLVHVNGTGAVALKTPTKPAALEVTPASGVIIPSRELVGWFGRLWPKKTSAVPFAPELDIWEISGEGLVLFCLEQNRSS